MADQTQPAMITFERSRSGRTTGTGTRSCRLASTGLTRRSV